jgi:hypothetical protein
VWDSGEREIKLADAWLGTRTSDFGWGAKGIFDGQPNRYWGWLPITFHLTGIDYKDHFADRKDVGKMNSLLAALSGRKVEEFERNMKMQKLMKEDKL